MSVVSVDRRVRRAELDPRDQEFLNAIRARFAKMKLRGRKISPREFKAAFKIEDAYVAKRIFSSLAEKGNTSLDRDQALSRIVALVLGDNETRLRFVFDLHDEDGRGIVTEAAIKRMLDASLRQNEITMSSGEKAQLIQAIFDKAEIKSKQGLDYASFKKLFKLYPEVHANVMSSIGAWFGDTRTDGKGTEKRRRRWGAVFLFLFTTVPAIIYRYVLIGGYIALNAWLAWQAVTSYQAAGANIYIQVARGAGAILNLNGALILLPMLRIMLGWIRRTPFARLIPVDEHISIHRIFGSVLFFMGIIHMGAHFLDYLTLPQAFDKLLFNTVAGLTGVIVTGALFLMWLFARKAIRRSGRFEFFFASHLLYVVWFVAMLIHAPNFWKWTIIPLALYGAEFILQRTRKRHISVVSKARVLPGEVTELLLHRPQGFEFQPGDYIYLRIPAVSRFEWHPFTISSNPEENDYISVHIRSLGNWTKAVKKLFGTTLKGNDRQIPVAIFGAFGTPSNRIFKARHAILIGAGIGVTPFASIMRSILHQHVAKKKVSIEKVHFFWLNRGQKTFDWFGNLLSDIETKSKKGLFDINIYMTNAQINASSGLARIGMELIRKETKRDLATGLNSVTHFGRPDWDKIFAKISADRGFGSVAVFFCGPEVLAASVREAAWHYGFSFRKENF